MFNEDDRAFYTKLDHWGFWTYPDEAMTVYESTFGPHEACFKCGLHPVTHEDLCQPCIDAADKEWARKLEARRALSERAMRRLRRTMRTLRELAKEHDHEERERLNDTASQCEAMLLTLDYWRHDYRGGTTPRVAYYDSGF